MPPNTPRARHRLTRRTRQQPPAPHDRARAHATPASTPHHTPERPRGPAVPCRVGGAAAIEPAEYRPDDRPGKPAPEHPVHAAMEPAEYRPDDAYLPAPSQSAGRPQ